jgi:hypothetical protein
MSRFHSLPRPALLVLRFLSALSLTATLLLVLVAALELWPAGASAAPAAQEPAFDCGTTVSEIPQAECQALVSLYNNTDGPHWISNTGWLQNATPCGWFGVTCIAGHVTGLGLPSNLLSGTVPSELGNLTELTELRAYSNRLSGDIKVLGRLSKLSVLDLHANKLNRPIPPELGQLTTTLTILNLGNNPLTGEIPAELGSLTSLKQLVLYSNELTGSIPSTLGNLTNLEVLGIYMNPLQNGPIPVELTQLRNLRQFWLASTNRTGPIPDLSQLTKLQNVHLGNNELTGGIPDLTHSPLMRELYLGLNRLTGPVPNEICDLPRLTVLGLDYNALAVAPEPKCLATLDPDWAQTQTVPPTDIQATAISTSSIRLTWNPIAYTADLGGYEVSYLRVGGGSEDYTVAGLTPEKSATAYTVTNLAAGTPYQLRVRTLTRPHAVPGAGSQRTDLWSVYSQDVVATTQVPAGTLVTVKRESEPGSPAAGAQLWLYRNGNRIAEVETNIHGQYVFSNLQAGDRLVGLNLQHEQPEAKALHDGWSYRVYLTSMDVAPKGTVTTTLITQPGQPLPPLVIKKTNPLILFNLLVSVESPVELSALQALSDTLRQASDFLYDVTDGQFALGKVAIYDAAKEIVNADMRVPANNGGIPNALVGGIAPSSLFTYTSPAKTIVYGSGFFRMTPDWPTGESSQVCGGYCKTLTHELAHYAFYLYDEYYRILPDGSRQPAHCTAPDLNPDRADSNASIMDNQVHATSELAMRKGTEPWSQWSTDCEQTEQWLLHRESDWETVANAYSDAWAPQPRWTFKTPAMIEQANPGPASLPLPDLPRVVITDFLITNPIPSPTVTVEISGGAQCGAQCQVYSLKKTNDQPSVILGLGSPQDGRIEVPGLQRGDELIGITTDGAYFGSLAVTGPGQTLTLEHDGWNPQVTAKLASHGITVTVTTAEALSGSLQAIRMDLGGAYSQTITLETSQNGVYTGTFDFDFNTTAREGYVWIWGTAANGRPLKTVTSYAVAGVPGSHEWAYLDLNSLEGTLHLIVPPGGVPTNTLVIVLPVRQLEPLTGRAPIGPRVSAATAPLGGRSSQPSLLTFVGTGYYLGATEGAVTGNITSTLTLFYGSDMGADLERAALYIYHYDDMTSQWENKGGVTDRENRSVSAPVNRFGIYALVKVFHTYLPIIVK